MLHDTETVLSFPDSIISRSQCLAGAIERGSPSVQDIDHLLMNIPAEVDTIARLVVRRVLMRVFARFVRGLDPTLDAASVKAFVVWSAADPASEQWRDDLLAVVAVWKSAQRITPAATPLVPRTVDSRIRHALDAIERRYAEPHLTLRHVARAANLSVCEAARRLKHHTGLGFVAHLHERRIAASRVHLAETALSIKEIADRVGYASASEFGRHFKRSSGMTPRQYRRTLSHTGDSTHNLTTNRKNPRLIAVA
jgi:AraC-like DNA-binding protein